MTMQPQQLQSTVERGEQGRFAGRQPSLRGAAGATSAGLEERLAALQRDHNELSQAIFAAAQVQRKLCAPREVRRGRFEIAGEIFPVRYLSGDFYQVLDLGAATGLAVGDIAGKGLAAGLWLAHLVGLVRAHLSSGIDLSETVSAINEELWRMQPETPMVALFLARLDQQSGELIYSNAGQPAPVVLRTNGRVESLEAGGPLLGALPRATFAFGRVLLGPGDTLVSYSDGIVECRNDQGEEFGAHRLIAASRSAGFPSAANLLFSLLGAAQDFAGSCPREDDLTLLVVCRPE